MSSLGQASTGDDNHGRCVRLLNRIVEPATDRRRVIARSRPPPVREAAGPRCCPLGEADALSVLPFASATDCPIRAHDGRHPRAGAVALAQVAGALVPGGRLFIDGGNPLRELALPA